MKNVMLIPLVLLTLTLTSGCDEDKRYVQLAQEADQRQAEQNKEIARQNQQIAEATKQLVEADAKARQDLAALERDLQAERAEVGRQRDVLESERRNLASQRQWDSLAAAAIENSGVLLICALPLLLCWFLLRDSKTGGNDEALGELLTIELTASEPSLLLPSNSAPPPERLLANDAKHHALTSCQDDGELPF